MSFPHHDRNWQQAADFVLARAAAADAILAPDPFWRLFARIYRYLNTRLKPDQDYQWAILHKGELAQIARSVLASISDQMTPVFANDVFVVWARDKSLQSVDPRSPHLISYFENIERLPPEPPLDLACEPVLPDAGQIVQFASLDDDALARAMDDFWRNGGYEFETLRDKTYCSELDRAIVAMMGSPQGQTILDLCCGSGRFRDILPTAASVVGVDISSVAIELARKRHAGIATFTFSTMDAHALSFPDASFDVVLFIESIEHVRQTARVVRECARVLKPGGRLVVTTANSNSLHQIVARKLGYRPYLTSFQHFREFTVTEVQELMNGAGLTATGSKGIFLFPYWGIPGIDEVVRPLTDDDPEIVEVTRVLGERVGPEYSYGFAIAARKQ